MKPFADIQPNKRQPKLALIGLSGVLVNSGLLWLLTANTALPFYLCSFIAIESSIIFNFLLNDIWTWADSRRGRKLARLLKYNLSTAFSSIFINIIVLLFLKEWIGIPFMLANLVGIGCGMLFNFIINHFWTYGDIRLRLERPVWIVLILSLAWRLGIAALIGAGFDEAIYYSYSIRPSLSYFDHPPFVGFLAGFFPYLTGIVSAFTIRLGAILLFTGSGLVFYKLARQFGNKQQALYAYILFNLTPMFMVGAGIMILPDSGLLFFWTLALVVLSRIFNRADFSTHNWIIAGLLTGFCMLSKYHGVLLGVCVLILLLLRYPRRIFKSGTLVYAAAALAVFSPVIVWNMQNHFVSFLFQGSRAIGTSISLTRFFQALGGQTAYLSPFIFFPLYCILFRVSRKAVKMKDPNPLFFAAFGAIPVLLILYISLFRQIFPHWTFPGYIALMIPLGQWLAHVYHKRRIVRVLSWAAVGCILLIEAVAVLHTRTGIFPLEKMADKGWISNEDVGLDITLDAAGWAKIAP